MLSVQKERLRPNIENQLEDVNCHHVTKLQELHKKVAATASNIENNINLASPMLPMLGASSSTGEIRCAVMYLNSTCNFVCVDSILFCPVVLLLFLIYYSLRGML